MSHFQLKHHILKNSHIVLCFLLIAVFALPPEISTSADSPQIMKTRIRSVSSELNLQKGEAVFTGDVVLLDPRMTLKTDKMEIHLKETDNGRKLKTLEAFGKVRIIQKEVDRKATGGYARYEADEGVMILKKDPKIESKGNVLRKAEKIHYHMRSNRITAQGTKKQRLVLIFAKGRSGASMFTFENKTSKKEDGEEKETSKSSEKNNQNTNSKESAEKDNSGKAAGETAQSEDKQKNSRIKAIHADLHFQQGKATFTEEVTLSDKKMVMHADKVKVHFEGDKQRRLKSLEAFNDVKILPRSSKREATADYAIFDPSSRILTLKQDPRIIADGNVLSNAETVEYSIEKEEILAKSSGKTSTTLELQTQGGDSDENSILDLGDDEDENDATENDAKD